MEKQSNLSPEIRDIWTDAFKFHATFEHMGNSPEEWERCAETMGLLSSKHGDHPLAKELLMTVYVYLDSERKKIAKEQAEQMAFTDVMASG